MFTEKQIKRFWSNVDVRGDDECWNWKLSTDRYGYGKTNIGQTYYISHRAAFTIANGEIPTGKHILHSCDNPICCNPSHLRAGSLKENMEDMVSRGRHGRVKVNPRKMNLEKANALREDFRFGMSKHALSRKYNISCIHVRNIIEEMYWINPSLPHLRNASPASETKPIPRKYPLTQWILKVSDGLGDTDGGICYEK